MAAMLHIRLSEVCMHASDTICLDAPASGAIVQSDNKDYVK